jgi:hypothetical protein
MVARLTHKLVGELLIVPLLIFVLTSNNKDDVVSAFVASNWENKNGRTPSPALIVVRDPSTVPAIDWDIFEMEEQRAFDTAAIIPPHQLSYSPPVTEEPTPYVAATFLADPGRTPGKIEIAPYDPDAWKGSLLMTAGLLAGHHDIPAMMLLLSTAASGEFGTAVRLTSRCLWQSVEVCQVLSTAGFQSITDLLRDVGVVEPPKSGKEGGENWMMSWAKRAWKDAVQQEREWASSIRPSFVIVPDEDVTKNEPEETPIKTAEPVQVFAATLLRVDGNLRLPITPTDPLVVTSTSHNDEGLQLPIITTPTDPFLASNNKQRVRDLMRQRRALQQPPPQLQQQQADVVAPDFLAKAHVTEASEVRTEMPNNAAAVSRQRVRDLMRQKRQELSSGSALADHPAVPATPPSRFGVEPEIMMSTPLRRQGDRSAADSRQRVRDLMRLQRERQQGYTPLTQPMASGTTTTTTTSGTTTPSLFTSPYSTTTTTAANFQSATQRAAHSRQRVRDLMRQKQAQEGRMERMAPMTAPLVVERTVVAAEAALPALVPEEDAAASSSSSFASMEDRFRKQRDISAAIRNKIRGMAMQKRLVDQENKEETEEARFSTTVSAALRRSPLTMTEQKTLGQARAALATARQMQTQLSALAVDSSNVEPEMSQQQRRSLRCQIAHWLTGASPHGWVAAK